MSQRRFGTGILFEEPNPTGSRPSDLIGLYRKWQRTKRPQPGELGIGIQQWKRHARSAVAVVMVASSEQANAWRPGREEAVKAMGLVRGTDQEERPQPTKKSSREEGGGDMLFKRETEHLCLRPLIHGMRRDLGHNVQNVDVFQVKSSVVTVTSDSARKCV